MASKNFTVVLRRLVNQPFSRISSSPLRSVCTLCHRESQHFLGYKSNDAKIGQNNLILKRFKKRASSKKDEDNEEEEDDDDDVVDENPMLVDDILENDQEGCESVTLDVGSLRLDAFAKSSFNMSRAKIEELFYKGDIYVNGEKVGKKSQELSIGDEIDIYKQVNAEDNTMVDVRRVHILELPDKTSQKGTMKVKINRWVELTIKPHES